MKCSEKFYNIKGSWDIYTQKINRIYSCFLPFFKAQNLFRREKEVHEEILQR